MMFHAKHRLGITRCRYINDLEALPEPAAYSEHTCLVAVTSVLRHSAE